VLQGSQGRKVSVASKASNHGFGLTGHKGCSARLRGHLFTSQSKTSRSGPARLYKHGVVRKILQIALKYPSRNTTRIPTKQQTAGDLSVTGPISRSGSRRPNVKQFSRDAAPRVYCLAEAPSAMHCHWPLRSIHVSAQPYDRLNSFPSLSLPFSVEVPHTVATLEP